MKSRSRPFQVEVRRAKGHSAIQKSHSEVVYRHRLPGLLFVGDWRDGLDPVTVPAAAMHATISDSGSPDLVEVPQARRVLPDLRPSIIAQGEERVSTARPAKRSKRKADKSPYPAMRALDQDQDRITSEALGTDFGLVDQTAAENDNSGTSAPQTGAMVQPSAQTALPTPVLAEAALRFSRRRKQATRLPRGERWKERRLPRVCWAKTGPTR
jgi:hypothetical protein